MIPRTSALRSYAVEDAEYAKPLLRNELFEILLHPLALSFQKQSSTIDISADACRKICPSIVETVNLKTALKYELQADRKTYTDAKGMLRQLASRGYPYLRGISNVLLEMINRPDDDAVVAGNASYFPSVDLLRVRKMIVDMNTNFTNDILIAEENSKAGGVSESLETIENIKNQIEFTNAVASGDERRAMQISEKSRYVVVRPNIRQFIAEVKAMTKFDLTPHAQQFVNVFPSLDKYLDKAMEIAHDAESDDTTQLLVLMKDINSPELNQGVVRGRSLVYPERERIDSTLQDLGVDPKFIYEHIAKLKSGFKELYTGRRETLYATLKNYEDQLRTEVNPMSIQSEYVDKLTTLIADIVPRLGNPSMLASTLVAMCLSTLPGKSLVSQYYQRIIKEHGMEPYLLRYASQVFDEIRGYQPRNDSFEKYIEKKINVIVPSGNDAWVKTLSSAVQIIYLQIARFTKKVSILPDINTKGLEDMIVKHIQNRAIFWQVPQYVDAFDPLHFPRLREAVGLRGVATNRGWTSTSSPIEKVDTRIDATCLLVVIVHYLSYMIAKYHDVDIGQLSEKELSKNSYAPGIASTPDESILRIFCSYQGLQQQVIQEFIANTFIYTSSDLSFEEGNGSLRILAKYAYVIADQMGDDELVAFFNANTPLMDKYLSHLNSFRINTLRENLEQYGLTTEERARIK